MLIIILLFLGLIIFFSRRNKKSLNKYNNTIETVYTKVSDDREFITEILEIEVPDGDTNIVWHKDAIKRGFAEGDFSLVNLSFAKIIERLRQINIKEYGKYDSLLETARFEYERFRETYNMQYPSQFLPPKKHLISPAPDFSNIQSQDIKIKVVSDNKKVSALINQINAKGHSEYPLLRKEYDVGSKIPCMDFSGWIIEQLKLNDYGSIYTFVKELYRPYNGFEDNIFKIKFETFLNTDFKSLFLNIDEEAVYEIRAFFIMNYGFERINREFWIVDGRQSYLLCKILSVYSFSINLESFIPLMNHANKFIMTMRKDTDYWKEFEEFQKEQLIKENILAVQTDLSSKLQLLSPGERLHFFDFSSNFNRFWNGSSSSKTRSFGIYEEKSISSILNLGIFDIVNDIGAIPQITSKGELKESAIAAGYEIKKSWTLDKIYENLLKSESGKTFLQEFIKYKSILSFNSKYDSDLKAILDYQIQIQRIVDLISMI